MELMLPDALLLETAEGLKNYKYPVDFANYYRCTGHRASVPAALQKALQEGTAEQTKKFEDYFRRNASADIHVWWEVVFWKLYRRRKNVSTICEQLKKERLKDLWETCQAYVNCPNCPCEAHFKEVLAVFNLKSQSIATVATFPAFMAPDKFPMVDRKVARWVLDHYKEHNRANPNGPQLMKPISDIRSGRVLTLKDFEFVKAWTEWCQDAARKLTRAKPLSSGKWRARDVEMAVFAVQLCTKDNRSASLTPIG